MSFGNQVILQGNWGTYTGLGVNKHNSGVFSGTTFGPEWAPTRERGDLGSQFLGTQSQLVSWVCFHTIAKFGYTT